MKTKKKRLGGRETRKRASIELRTWIYRIREKTEGTKESEYKKNRMCDWLGDPRESAKEDDKERDIFSEVQWIWF